MYRCIPVGQNLVVVPKRVLHLPHLLYTVDEREKFNKAWTQRHKSIQYMVFNIVFNQNGIPFRIVLKVYISSNIF